MKQMQRISQVVAKGQGIKRIGILMMSMYAFAGNVWSQCATCKAAAASRDASGDLVVGSGLNSAILYLLAMPFLISAVIGIIWYRNRKQLEKL